MELLSPGSRWDQELVAKIGVVDALDLETGKKEGQG